MNIYVDGSYCQITKKAGIGVSIAQDGVSSSHHFISESVDAWCSLKAEILAIMRAVDWVKDRIYDKAITIHTDCQVIVNSFNKSYLIKGFQPVCSLLYSLLRSYKIKLKWVKREKNTVADRLARQARKL